MADSKITALTALTAADPANDMIPIVDVSDTPPASGNTKRISINNLLACSPSATLASATISGDLTVDTSTLKVDSANNRVGIGTASPNVRMELSVADAAEGARLTASSAWLRLFPYLDATDKTKIQAVNGTNTALSDLTLEGLGLRFNTNAGLSYAISNASIHTWQNVGGTSGTAMTLNASGLGVGASPANGKLIVGADATTDGNGSWNTTLRNTVGAATTAPKTGLAFSGYWNGTSNFANFAGISGGKENTTDANTAGILTMWTSPNGGSPTTRLTVDSSGNVGIGVTPSAWATIYKAIELPNGSSIWGQTDVPQLSLQTNAFLNSSFQWIYKTTAAASNYRQTAGAHLWFTATSGTLNTEILQFSTAKMTLDASGNLILLSSNTPATLTTNGQLTVNATSNTNLRFSYRGSDGTTRVANITLA